MKKIVMGHSRGGSISRQRRVFRVVHNVHNYRLTHHDLLILEGGISRDQNLVSSALLKKSCLVLGDMNISEGSTSDETLR